MSAVTAHVLDEFVHALADHPVIREAVARAFGLVPATLLMREEAEDELNEVIEQGGLEALGLRRAILLVLQEHRDGTTEPLPGEMNHHKPGRRP